MVALVSIGTALAKILTTMGGFSGLHLNCLQKPHMPALPKDSKIGLVAVELFGRLRPPFKRVLGRGY